MVPSSTASIHRLESVVVGIKGIKSLFQFWLWAAWNVMPLRHVMLFATVALGLLVLVIARFEKLLVLYL